MNDFHKLIYDEEQVRRFVQLLSPPKDEEVYLISISARKKYLSEEERQSLKLNRTEMFGRKLVKYSSAQQVSFEDVYLRVLHSMEVARGGYISKTGKALPDKCLVIYANINPSSGIKALKEFQKDVVELLFNLPYSESLSPFAHLDSRLMNHYNRQRGTKNLIDIDFDIPEEGISLLKDFLNELKRGGVPSNGLHVVSTRSGWHVLIDMSYLQFNYPSIVQKYHELAVEQFGTEHIEIVVNRNEMIPVPGTLQGDYEVRFVDEP